MSELGFLQIWMFYVTEDDSSFLWHFYNEALEVQVKLSSFLGLIWNVCVFIIHGIVTKKYIYWVFPYKPYEFASEQISGKTTSSEKKQAQI